MIMEKQFKFVNVTINAVTDENEEECIIENADVEQLNNGNGLYGASKFIEFIEDNVYLEHSISKSLYFQNNFHGNWAPHYWFDSEYDYIEVYFRSVNQEEKEIEWVGTGEIETYIEESIELEITLHKEKNEEN